MSRVCFFLSAAAASKKSLGPYIKTSQLWIPDSLARRATFDQGSVLQCRPSLLSMRASSQPRQRFVKACGRVSPSLPFLRGSQFPSGIRVCRVLNADANPDSGIAEKTVIWVRFGSHWPVSIDPGNAKVVSQLLQIIKRTLSPATDPFSISELKLMKPNGLMALPKDQVDLLLPMVSYETPLCIVQPQKTIYIRNVDEDLRPLLSYTEVSVECNADVTLIWEGKGSGLIKLSHLGKKLTKFDQLEDGGRYAVFSRYEYSMMDEVRWQQREDQAMKVKIAQAVRTFLLRKLGEAVKDLPTDFYYPHGGIAQEWDAIYRVSDTIYLCQAKHVMSIEKVRMFPARLKQFNELQAVLPLDYSAGVKNIVGVACGTWFPPVVQEEAQRMGVLCVYPSGMRYWVGDEPPGDFVLSRGDASLGVSVA
ncbi:unnamed protein product [Calypogeia fissa]